MEENMKNRIILILAISTVIFFMGTISSCMNATQLKGVKDKEMRTRLDAEEKMNKLTQDKIAIEGKMKKLAIDLDTEKTAHEATKKALQQEQAINASLKDELDKVTKLKDTLENNLKEALSANKSAEAKK